MWKVAANCSCDNFNARRTILTSGTRGARSHSSSVIGRASGSAIAAACRSASVMASMRLQSIFALCLERFPKRLNLEGFPYGHESDSRFALERRPVWDGEAVFGGFAYARGEGGGGGRHDTGNCGVPRCEYQLCGPLS